MNRAVVSAAKSFMNVLFPIHCASCRTPLDTKNIYGVCSICIEKIKPGRIFPQKGPAGASFTKTYSATLYEGVIKDIVHQLKYKNRLGLSRICSDIMVEFARKTPEIFEGISLVTFVPLHSKRQRQRSFNQSRALADGLSRQFGVRLEDTLDKRLFTKYQNELTRDERLTNLIGAFTIKSGVNIAGSKVLLVDDVLTTGSTLDECSRVLTASGANETRCFTLAKGA